MVEIKSYEMNEHEHLMHKGCFRQEILIIMRLSVLLFRLIEV